ncbi:polysaccharide deacetylase [Mesorhizobium sp. M7A.F.Ca.CA.001.09.2.1]|uniref:Chitooligosaccharide deacetylase n=1 Tax=Mesorhizobium ciceri TaxID=39645 RepID=A0AB38TEY9_9HYPH|nr:MULTISPECIES: polysaccharide deacetylase [Mesorhizobium]RUY56094.1 polysaccharide deacetylase [Mesorhizobium sp. M7A.F.Ca.CA.001.13.2.1]MDF3218272.1 polysaccharide deacetylase [Mesorhizobium ciceri]RUY71327.1 polysaccharide deacetylase [Mesorhizobium sp. M7A.F.Ca.CA.001.13.1.1]RUY74432.1 polysaccharide deacetylase [Mesorhizobium sp. M7A.F.Ca.CA.001.05.1.1]RUY80592.1 polysaccharide deacetylase [Mesorhizobium sp. M7A.F.Ca.CA.001.09.2.1]
MGKLKLPAGKKIAVNLGADFDAQALWLGGFNRPTPSAMSRGEFGAAVGVPRLLDLFKREGIRSTFFTPAHTVDTFPEVSKRIRDEGHEIGHHGYYHENPTLLSSDTEKRLMDLAFRTYKKVLDLRPVGYRSPYWDFSDNTLDLIEEAGFSYDSSLMARDLVPYRPQRWQIRWEEGNVAGPASKVLELPVSWYLDDWPPFAYTGTHVGMGDTDIVLRRWKDIFDYAYKNQPDGVYTLALHPQIIGQAHHMVLLERLIKHIKSHEGVWFATCEEIAGCWEDDADDRRLMALPDARGVEPMPADYSWPGRQV